jgi:autotransporter-associated beta strand protein
MSPCFHRNLISFGKGHNPGFQQIMLDTDGCRHSSSPPSPTTMKIFPRLPLAPVYLCFVAAIGISNSARAGNATWDVNPGSGDWNAAANWTPATVPSGSGDTATFGLSNTTDVFISSPFTTVNGITFTPGATNPYTITASAGLAIPLALYVSGLGITNNSGIMQNFVTTVQGPGNFFGEIFFESGTAGSLTTFTNSGGKVNAVNGGLTTFSGASSAANGSFINNGGTASGASGGSTDFFVFSTAGNGTFTNNGATVLGATGGVTLFGDTSTAASATITNNGATVAGAGSGFTEFRGGSTASNATLIANGGMGGGQGGRIFFEQASTGGTSRIELFGNGSLDISRHDFHALTVGSIEGDGNAFLGAKTLTVGSNNLSTTFSGVLQDGGATGGTGGSLTKVGSGTLDLTGVNTYTGTTNVNHGILQVDGSITSSTIVHEHGTLSGTGTIHGSVTNNGMVSPGDAPGTLTVNSYTQMSGSTLLIDIAGPNTGQFSVLDVLGNANVNPNGLLLPVLQNGFVPTVGESFTFLEYGSHTGSLFIHDRNIDATMEHWDISYKPGHALLSVAAGNVSIPDQASTLLLMTLSLLGLVSLKANLRRS